jgi:hypothetical protein
MVKYFKFLGRLSGLAIINSNSMSLNDTKSIIATDYRMVIVFFSVVVSGPLRTHCIFQEANNNPRAFPP